MSSRITAFVNVLSDTDKHFKYANEKSPAMLLVKTYQRATDACDNFTAKIKTAALKREVNRLTSKIATLYLMLRHFTLNPQNFPHPYWQGIIKVLNVILGKSLPNVHDSTEQFVRGVDGCCYNFSFSFSQTFSF